MAFLRINGIEVPVANDSAEFSPEIIGENGRAPDASLWLQRTAVKRAYGFATPPRPATEALAFMGLILGEGHVWPFSAALGLYSSRGSLITSSGATVARSTLGGKFGADSCYLDNADTIRTGVFYPTAAGRPEPTISFWFSDDATATWSHRVYRPGASQWYSNGAATSAPSGIAATYSGTYGWQIANTSGAARYFDDLWICPYDWPATWPALVYAYNLAVGLAPRLKIDGEAVAANLVTVDALGEVSRASLAQGRYGASFQTNLHAVEFGLREV